MTLFDRFKTTVSKEPDKPLPEMVEGKIYYINKDKGYGFISSKAVPFERVFFHWQDLRNDTIKFTDLKRGMLVHFTPTYKEDKESYRAIKIRVLPRDEE